MIISLHTDHVKIDHIYEFIMNITKNIKVTFKLMFNPDKFEYVKEIFATLIELRKSHYFSLDIVLLRQKPKYISIDKRYTDEHFKWRDSAINEFRKISKKSDVRFTTKHKNLIVNRTLIEVTENHKVISKYNMNHSTALQSGHMDFRKMYCVWGANLIYIEEDGTCEGAVCSAQSGKTRRFNIFKENPYKDDGFINYVVCPFDSCGCATNNWLPKFRDKVEAETFVTICKQNYNRE